VDERAAGYRELLAELYSLSGRARTLGVTGAPGAGKSTLTDALITELRKRGERVGVVAIDPSSPFSGGALLGDRIRMQRHAMDPEVFIRSVATRGAHGGLSRSASELVLVLEAWGATRIILETVGVGQAELDVLGIVQTVLLAVMPGAGDDVQANKAGILEIADLFALNKADRAGADAAERELQLALALGRSEPRVVAGQHSSSRMAGAVSAPGDGSSWEPPIVRTVAPQGTGIGELLEHWDAHAEWLSGTPAGRERSANRQRLRLLAFFREVLADAVFSRLASRIDELIVEVAARRVDPYAAVDRLIEAFRADSAL
jgi:LAO/AO transport system kinase